MELNETQLTTEDVKVQQLEVILLRHGVDTSLWGNGETKTIEHLAAELADGTATLVEIGNNELARLIKVVSINVRYMDSTGKTYVLKETKQIFKDGRVRNRILDTSIGEKVNPGEQQAESVTRALREELGVQPMSMQLVNSITETRESPSFPGLFTVYERHKFSVYLDQDAYRPEGYIEEQPDKTTYFEWHEEIKT